MSSSSEPPEFSDSENSFDGYLDDDGAQAPVPQEAADFLGGRGFNTGFFSSAGRPARPMSDFLGRGTGAAIPLPPTVISTAQLRTLQEQLNLDDYDDMDEGSDYAPGEPWGGVDEVVEQIMADMEAQLDVPRGLATAPGLGPPENLSRMLAQLLGLGPGLGGPTAGGAGLGGLELDSFTELRVPELASLGMGGDAAAAAAAAERRHALNMLDWGFPTAADPARHAALAAEGVPAGRMEHASLREAPIQISSAASSRQPRPAEFPPGHPFRRLGDMPNAQPAPRGLLGRFSQQPASSAAGPGFNLDEPPGLTSSDDEWDLPIERAQRRRRQLARGGSNGGVAAAQARSAAAGGAGTAAAAGRGMDDMPGLISDVSSTEESEGSDSEGGGNGPPALGLVPRQGAHQPRRAPARGAEPGSSAAAGGPARQRPQQQSRAPAAARTARARMGDDDSSMPSLMSEDDDSTDSDYMTDGEDIPPALRDFVFPGFPRLNDRQIAQQPVAQRAGQRSAAQQAQSDPLGEAMRRFMAQQGARRQQAGQQPAAQQAGQQPAAQQAGQRAQQAGQRAQQAGQRAGQRAARPRRNAIFGVLPGLGGQGGLLPAELLGRETGGSGASAAAHRAAGDAESDMPPLLEPDTHGSEWESGDSEHGRSGYLEDSEAVGRGSGSGTDDALPALIDSDEDSEESEEESERAPWMPGQQRPAGQLARQGSGGSEAAGEAAATAAEEATLLEVLGRRLGSMHRSVDEGGDGLPELEPLEASSTGAAEGGPAGRPGAAAPEEVAQVAANSASPSSANAPAASATAALPPAASAPAAAATEAQECNPERLSRQQAQLH